MADIVTMAKDELKARGKADAAALAARAVTGWDTAPCGNALIAQSQKIKLQKAGASPRAWARWLAFWGLCQAPGLRTEIAPKPEKKR